MHAQFDKHDLPFDVLWLDIEHTLTLTLTLTPTPTPTLTQAHETCRSLECISYAAKGGCSCRVNSTCSSTNRVCRKAADGKTKCEETVANKMYCTDVPRRAQLSSLVTAPSQPLPPVPSGPS